MAREATEVLSFEMDSALYDRLVNEAQITCKTPEQIAQQAIKRYLCLKQLDRADGEKADFESLDF